ncbi:nicotinamide-nucleotide adenylyltransferase [Lactobacillus phage LpeD]|uniref:Nicotinamide-nucleotide adenylyltransferase n=1 Tax=Lactobacillus phage LpeD TaxID=2041210 RepID=A0A291I9M1_9CAUD|nr:nicotinamide-nucleotide adenylyltransferase [Lactobacillus phage LpeD]ATG86385.1 nicotinamide-nucleotide adenylyltransferase [Lactobacillus phage LpeD]
MNNLELITKNKLSGKKIGVYFGTFAPFHIGHQQDLYRALAVNDGVVLVVSGYKGDRGDNIGLSLYKRFRYLRESFADEPNIVVAMLNEDKIPRYPNGWEPWLEKLKSIVNKAVINQDADITVYTGEKEYDDKFHELLPSWKTELENRKTIPISATMIRNDPHKYWNYINRVFRRHFTYKVLVTGSASVGKSTLIKHVARSINAPFSTEFARDYEEKYNLTDDELTVDDYSHFFQGQYDANKAEMHSASNQGTVICDTDAMVTDVYAKMYLPKEDYENLTQIYANVVKHEDWDLIIVIPPVTKYVDDGFRNMDWENTRDEFHDNLMEEISNQGFADKVVILDDKGNSSDPQGFLARYERALELIKNGGK